MKKRRALLLSLLVLLLVVGFPVGFFVRAVHHEQLNRSLIAAVENDDFAAVRRLLRQSADPNTPVFPEDTRTLWQRVWDTYRPGHSPHPTPSISILFEAASHLSKEYDQAERSAVMQNKPFPPIPDNVEIIQALADAGADVNYRGGGRNATPLIVAAYFGKFETMKVLLAHNADVTVVDSDGGTALASAASQANVEVVEALLQRGADIHRKDKLGRTALHAVLGPYQSRSMDKIEAMVACLIRHGASVSEKDNEGNSIMALASRFNDPPLMQMLKQAGAKE